jgi:hypothetical protein
MCGNVCVERESVFCDVCGLVHVQVLVSASIYGPDTERFVTKMFPLRK